MHLTTDEHGDRPVDVIFDNKTASRVARSHGEARRHPLLSATAATVWQILSMRRAIRWFHTYSHCGEVLNEIVDDLVARGPWSYSRVAETNAGHHCLGVVQELLSRQHQAAISGNASQPPCPHVSTYW